MKKILICLCFSLTVPFVVASTDNSTEQICLAYFEHTARGQERDAVSLLAPEELVKLKSALVEAAEIEKRKDVRSVLNFLLGPDATISDIKKTSPTVLAEKLVRGSFDASSNVQLQFVSAKVLGVVDEKQTRHCLVRSTVRFREESFDTLEVVSVKQVGDRWAVLLPSRLEAVLASWRDTFK